MACSFQYYYASYLIGCEYATEDIKCCGGCKNGQCCSYLGQSCKVTLDCCDAESGATCEGVEKKKCCYRYNTGSCTDGSQCCSGTCLGGKCCAGTGNTCDINNPCCEGSRLDCSGTVDTNTGKPTCCTVNGGQCTVDAVKPQSTCCPGLTCMTDNLPDPKAGTCKTCIPKGGLCDLAAPKCCPGLGLGCVNVLGSNTCIVL